MGSLPEIKKHLVSLAQEIQAVFPDLYLAGGTAIMIKYEHRISYDIDLFAENSRLSTLESRMRKRYESEIERIVHFPGGDNVDFFLRGTKLSFVGFPFPNVEPTETRDGVRMASDRDLLLNKIYVAGRRVEAKDPVDIACLLLHHPDWPLDAVRSDFRAKFKNEKFEIYLAAVMAFDDYPGLDEATRSFLEQWNGSD
jgi:hypothetical protein